MSHSWVMVWIPTKTLEKKKTSGIDINISQKHRIRLFSDSSTITEGSVEELKPGSLDIPLTPAGNPSRGDVFSTQPSTEKTDSLSISSDAANIQKIALPATNTNHSKKSIDIGDGVPLAPNSKNTFENTLLDVLTSLDIRQAISQKTKDNNFVLVTFCVNNELLEETFIRLGERGIGNSANTSISILPASVHVTRMGDDYR